jgi:hypothetical protein
MRIPHPAIVHIIGSTSCQLDMCSESKESECESGVNESGELGERVHCEWSGWGT